ncbi:hypothetical protein K2173_010133 [Erythroxylum novogranatense]|uniref:NAD(P)H-quinone oxidoreductase subunit L, chloroplastic n=1 Tax=Erythroxylum novogranatense TaxID=1862640 RepID=A0AAV8TWI5_9ROSI|nr:hypothetical protein K2173_010133 [Erythroxylum novogranatense]
MTYYSCSLCSNFPTPLPPLSHRFTNSPLHSSSNFNSFVKPKLHLDKVSFSFFVCNSKNLNFKQKVASTNRKHEEHHDDTNKTNLAIQIAAVLATVEQPALAVTGVNNEEDPIWVLIQLAIVAFFYFILTPPIIMNWLRIRWYKRNLLEMYLQFMFVFIFFPGIILWAPFLNFRKFPRDPSMKYPWSTPKDPSKVKNYYLRYPFATPDDYE